MRPAYKLLAFAWIALVVAIVSVFIIANMDEPVEESTYVAPHSVDRPGVTYTEYRMSNDTCSVLFACSVEEFFGEPYDFSWTEDFRTYSRKGENGDLLLRLNDQQKKDWIARYSKAIKRARDVGVEFSDDYTKITLRGYKETMGKLVHTCMWSSTGALVQQVVAGTEPDKAQIQVVVIDAVTNDVVYSILCPQEPFFYSYDAYGLNSIHSNWVDPAA